MEKASTSELNEKALEKFDRLNPIVDKFVASSRGFLVYTTYARAQGAVANNVFAILGYTLRALHQLENALANGGKAADPAEDQRHGDTARRLVELHRRIAQLEELPANKLALDAKAKAAAAKEKKT